MAKRKSALEPETDLWEAFSEPGETPPDDPFVDVDDKLDLLDEADLKAVDKAVSDRLDTLTAAAKPTPPPKPVKAVKVAPKVETTKAKAVVTTPDPEAIPKGMSKEDQALYKAMPYYGMGENELHIFKAIYKHDPTLEEFDKLVSTFNKWQMFDWCIAAYGLGHQCPTAVFGEDDKEKKIEAPRRFCMRWRRLDKRFWKKE